MATTNNNNNNNSSVTTAGGGSGSSTKGGGGGGGSHGYCLKWKYHPNNLLHMFNQLLLNESFTDVVVACQGKAIKCHKMVLSACSKYFEQVFTEYPQQSSTLVILKDMKFTDVQAIIEFMYQGEINVAHDQLTSLLKAAESLQVKGLADITGTGGGGGGSGGASLANHSSSSSSGMGVTGLGGAGTGGGGNSSHKNLDDNNDDSYMGLALGGGGRDRHNRDRDRDDGGRSDDSAPPSPPSIHMDGGGSDGGSDGGSKNHRKRGRGGLDGMSLNASGGVGGGLMAGDGHFDDFSLGNLLESHFALQARARKRNRIKPGLIPGMELEQHMMDDDENDDDIDHDEEITEEDLTNIVKMNDYIEKGGSRPQFWDEPTTKKIMNAIRSKKMEMKAAAEILGVSYSTLYSRYRELHGYLKMPHTQDTNFNYYQVLNLLRAGQITLADAAKRLNIHEKTLGSYLTTSITPKKPRITPSTSTMSPDPQNYALQSMLGNVNFQANQISSVLESSKGGGGGVVDDYSDDSDLDDQNPSPLPTNINTTTTNTSTPPLASSNKIMPGLAGIKHDNNSDNNDGWNH